MCTPLIDELIFTRKPDHFVKQNVRSLSSFSTHQFRRSRVSRLTMFLNFQLLTIYPNAKKSNDTESSFNSATADRLGIFKQISFDFTGNVLDPAYLKYEIFEIIIEVIVDFHERHFPVVVFTF